MGAQLVMAAYTYWSEACTRCGTQRSVHPEGGHKVTVIGHGPFRLFVRLALTARDDDRDPKAWVGRDELARSLGLAPTPGTFRNVRRWLSQLEKAGAIERTEVGKNGRRSTYLVHASPAVDRVENPVHKAIRRAVQGGRSDPPKGGRSDPPKGGRSDPPKGGRSDPPEEPLEEPMKEYGKENHLASTNSR